jgi:ABC-2 type transport system ATP-binding protein
MPIASRPPVTTVRVATSPSSVPGAPPIEAIISAAGLTRRFGDLLAVRELTFSVEPGTILGLIGPSGSGKTTTIRMLTGTLDPSEGQARVLGEDPRTFSRRAREQLAYMPQLFSLFPYLSAEENVGFVAALFGISPWRRRRVIRRALEVVDLWDARQRLAHQLSAGMQRRLELACALVHEPRVLFIDEPTAGIDPMLRQALWDELRRLRNEGRTLLVTTQYVGEAEYCDRVALLDRGQLVALDDPVAMRRSMFGGEVLEVEGDRRVDPEMLADIEGVSRVRQTAERKLVVVSNDAGRTAPRVVEALRARGVGVIDADEYEPSFDEVFADLVERWRTNGTLEDGGT